MRYGFLNGFKANLAQPLAVDATTLELTNGGAQLSDASEDYRYRLTLFTVEVVNSHYVETQREVIDVIGVSGNTLTIEGGKEGTSRPTGGWPVDDTNVELRYTAELVSTGAGTWSAFDAQGIVKTNGDGTAKALTVGTGIKELPTLVADDREVIVTPTDFDGRRLALSPDETLLVVINPQVPSSGVRQSGKVYNLADNSLVVDLPTIESNAGSTPLSAVFSPDGSHLYVTYPEFVTNHDAMDASVATGMVRCFETTNWSIVKDYRADEAQIVDNVHSWGPKHLHFVEGTDDIIVGCEGSRWNDTAKGTPFGISVINTQSRSVTFPTTPYLDDYFAETANPVSPGMMVGVASRSQVVLTETQNNYPRPAEVLQYDTLTGTYQPNMAIRSAFGSEDTEDSGHVFLTEDRYAWVVAEGYVNSGIDLFRIIDLEAETVWYPTDGSKEQQLGIFKDVAVDEDNGTATFFTDDYILTYDLKTRAQVAKVDVTTVLGDTPWNFVTYSNSEKCFYGTEGTDIQKLPYSVEKKQLVAPQHEAGHLRKPVATIKPVLLMSEVLDLTDAAGVVSFAADAGWSMFIDKIDIVVESGTATAGAPEIQVGVDNATPGNYLASTAVTVTAAGERQTHTPILLSGTPTIEAAVSVASTGTDHKVRFVLSGYAKKD